jgi:hypothetical protein
MMLSIVYLLTQLVSLWAFGSAVMGLQYLASWKDRKSLKIIARFYKELSEG